MIAKIYKDIRNNKHYAFIESPFLDVCKVIGIQNAEWVTTVYISDYSIGRLMDKIPSDLLYVGKDYRKSLKKIVDKNSKNNCSGWY